MRSAGYIDAERLPFAEVERRACARLAEGATLVFFPEGQRSRSGALGRFHAGAFRIALCANRPIIPMLIYDSFTVFPPGARVLTPAPIHIELLEPIDPAPFAKEALPHRALLRHVAACYRRKLSSL